MEKSGLISVIIPVYNVEKYLEECINSVLNQTYQNFEIILVDDGSTDSSGKICDSYKEKDNRITVIHQENKGLSETRNRGYVESNGEYIYFLDSDDWILPNALMELYERAKTENVDVVFFDAISFFDNTLEKCKEQTYVRNKIYKSNRGIKVLEELIDNKEYHSAVPLLFLKRDLLQSSKISFFPNILYEDMIFTYEVFIKSKRVAQINKSLYQRRFRDGSIMTSYAKKKNFVSAKIAYREVRDFSKEENLLGLEFAQSYVSRCAFNVINIYNRQKNEVKKECKADYKKIIKEIRDDGAYQNKALLMRTYGILPWFVYKIFEKITMKIRRK